jgi:carbonic anhydrase/acetyltransferase-like protein (isoleucine patch superfamily)
MIIETSNGRPTISPSAFVSASAVVIGNVMIGDDVLVAPNATIRADEPGSLVVIGPGCNVQDNAVVHALGGSTAEVRPGSTLGHGCIVHGPCVIGERCFIGFGSIVFASELGDGCFVLHRAVVHNVVVPGQRMVGNGVVVDNDDGVAALEEVPQRLSSFAAKVVEVNRCLAHEYRSAGRMEGEGQTAATRSNVNSPKGL